ncbi:1-acyl-sn-glycerol-3-phosphate acyltransferase [Weissella diestrammenae]|uniref:1-acyl-sn-glycerol-3-phosphate acyltransferase n=1 Tax=Weissella diestrammenae TaxID=1162633 RepID=A0A7G9T5T9_9LACO|nr:1-acyl-sn-glycerol-3-phosphate acyltransferase [Weissella diestrammenae]MCM0582293.1 1-acyl-sn-glycerol-3-phosphate acyltransferase [Weissella diestrammenae]QNN75464.1 1-acyl-sn-glycerol-3-phosphate acyltransferase [Weissella diestrammenae]
MFYHIAARIVQFIIWLINGKYTLLNQEKLPDDNYILVGPHRTWWDPLYFAVAGYPNVYMFMAKKELFKNPIIGWIISHSHGFAVDRENPGPSVIKIPVNGLKKDNLSLIMFPSGSRHSQEMKDGALVIARLAKKPIVPLVYQGPLKFSDLFKRNNVTMAYGDPIYPDQFSKQKELASEEFNAVLTASFEALDAQINPNWHYVDVHPERRENYLK